MDLIRFKGWRTLCVRGGLLIKAAPTLLGYIHIPEVPLVLLGGDLTQTYLISFLGTSKVDLVHLVKWDSHPVSVG